MAAYLLDSNILIDALNQRRSRDQLLRNLVLEHHALTCCSINITEVYAGMRPEEESRTAELLDNLEYCHVTREIARQAGLLKRDYARRGITLSLADATVAAVAMAHRMTLVTDNVKDYPMPDIQLYSPPR